MSQKKIDSKAMSDKAASSTDVSRRNVLRGGALTMGGAVVLATAMTAQRAEAKMAQTAAGYQATPKDGKSCDSCSLFITPASCKLIDGAISPSGYCRFYVKKS
jgi:cell division ATPase FtsA